MKEISRRTAMQYIQSGKEVLCQLSQNDEQKVSTMEGLTRVIMLEQNHLTDPLKFFEN